jgi:hypothetical protein
MVSELRKAYTNGELDRVTDSGDVDTVLARLMGIDWVVYTKPWLRQAETVVDYLARYTHRTAISDSRIGAIADGEVAVGYKDYRDNNRWKTMHLPGEELIRRFVLHILPKGLMRIAITGFSLIAAAKTSWRRSAKCWASHQEKPRTRRRQRQKTTTGLAPNAIEAKCACS